MNKFYFISFFSLLLLYSCKSATKAYNKGDYRDAIDLSIKKLQKDPDDGTAKAILKDAYKNAVALHEDKIRSLSNTTNPNRWEQIYHEYNNLQSLYNRISRFPALAKQVNAADYSSYLDTYRNKAAEVHVERGEKLMEEDSKLAYREAYEEFRKAMRYKQNDYELKKKMEEAYDAALIKVLVVSADAFEGNYYYSQNAYQLRNFQDRIMRTLTFHSGNNFVKFYASWEAQSRRVEPDEILEMRLGRINIGQPYDQYATREVTNEVVVKETVYKADSVVKEYAKVKAKITTTKRLLVSDADLYLTARDPRGRIIWSDILRGEHRWQVEFATFTGDERALSASDRNLLNKPQTQRPPNSEDITGELLQQIESGMTNRLRNYYQRYF